MISNEMQVRDIAAEENIVIGERNSIINNTIINIFSEKESVIEDIINKIIKKESFHKSLKSRRRRALFKVVQIRNIGLDESLYSQEVNIFLNMLISARKFVDKDEFDKAKKIYNKIVLCYKKINNIQTIKEDCLGILISDLESFALKLHRLGDKFRKNTTKMIYAENLYRDTLEIRRLLFTEKPDEYRQGIGLMLLDLGDLVLEVSSNKRVKEAEELYRESLSLFESGCQKKFKPEIADTLCLLAYLLQLDNSRLAESNSFYKKAVVLLKELVVENYSLYIPDLADALFGYGNTLDEGSAKFEEIIDTCYEAFEIYKQMSLKNKLIYKPKQALMLLKIAKIKIKLGFHQIDKVEEIYYECLKIYNELADIKPDEYLPNVATTLCILGEINALMGDRKNQAEEFYKKALDIEIKLAEKNERHQSRVAEIFRCMADLKVNKNESNNAEELYKKSLKIWQSINEPIEGCALTLFKLGDLICHDDDRLIEAKEVYEESLRDYQCLNKECPYKFKIMEAKLLSKIGRLDGLNLKLLYQSKLLYFELLDIYRIKIKKSPQSIEYKIETATILSDLRELLKHIPEQVHSLEILCKEEVDLWRMVSSLKPFYSSMLAMRLGELISLSKENKEDTIFIENLCFEKLSICDGLLNLNPERKEFILMKILSLYEIIELLISNKERWYDIKKFYDEEFLAWKLIIKINLVEYNNFLILRVLKFTFFLEDLAINESLIKQKVIYEEIESIFLNWFNFFENNNKGKYLEHASDLAILYFYAGRFSYSRDDNFKAQKRLVASYNNYKKLEKNDHDVNLKDIAMVSHYLGSILPDSNYMCSFYYEEAKKFYRILSDNNPDLYLSIYAQVLSEYACRMPDKPSVREDYRKAINIQKKLTDINPEKYQPDLALTYYRYAYTCYYYLSNKGEAILYSKRSSEIYEKLSKKYPDFYSDKYQESLSFRKKILTSRE